MFITDFMACSSCKCHTFNWCSKKEHYTAVSVWLELNLLELLLPFLTVVTSFVEGPQLSSTALIMLPTLCPVLLPPDVLFPKLACLCNTLWKMAKVSLKHTIRASLKLLIPTFAGEWERYNEWEHFGVKLEQRLSWWGIVPSEVFEIRNGTCETGNGTLDLNWWSLEIDLLYRDLIFSNTVTHSLPWHGRFCT